MPAKCEYPLFDYLTNSLEQEAALTHASQCLICAEKIVMLEVAIRKTRHLQAWETTLSDWELAILAEKFLALGEAALIQNPEFALIKKHPGNLAFFQQLLAYLQDNYSSDKLQAPENLKNFVSYQLTNDLTKEPAMGNKVFLRIRNGLKLLVHTVGEVFVLPDLGEAVTVRSSGGMEMTPVGSVVQFLTPAIPQGKVEESQILYQVVQDSNTTVMLTVRLQNCLPLPRIINLKREDRLIYSYPIKEEYAYFPQLLPGSYLLELKDQLGAVTQQLAIEIT